VTSTSNVNSLPFSDLRKRAVDALTKVFAPTDRGFNAATSEAGTEGWCIDVERCTGFPNIYLMLSYLYINNAIRSEKSTHSISSSPQWMVAFFAKANSWITHLRLNHRFPDT
jgi:hypothetical protein